MVNPGLRLDKKYDELNAKEAKCHDDRMPQSMYVVGRDKTFVRQGVHLRICSGKICGLNRLVMKCHRAATDVDHIVGYGSTDLRLDTSTEITKVN